VYRALAALLRALTATPAGRRLLLAPPAPRAHLEAPALDSTSSAPALQEQARGAARLLTELLRLLCEGGLRSAPPKAVADFVAALCSILRCPEGAPQALSAFTVLHAV